MIWYFVFFFVSGFCGILYEIVWLRLAMAQFGVTNALVSIVLSMFMAGLGLGSWGSGLLARRYGDRAATLGLRLYALAELLIGISALLVPLELGWGRALLERVGLPSSGTYYFASAIWIAFTLVPWCAAMGATIPLAMEAIRSSFRGESSSSFSFLYLANVVGASAGAILPLFLIELFGFRGTLRIGAAANCALAVAAGALSLRARIGPATTASASNAFRASGEQLVPSRRPLLLLLATGLTSMGLEVVWIRQFTPYLGTMVYAFATILALYLLSTLLGSKLYRAWNKKGRGEPVLIWLGLGFCACLSLAAGDPQFRIPMMLRPVIGIVPFSMILGFITPLLVDRWSAGNPHRAGTAYAANVVGCILGPLLSGFLLLPFASEHWVICILGFPWIAVGWNPQWLTAAAARGRLRWVGYTMTLLALQLAWVSKGYESQFPNHEVLRDSTATIVAYTRPDGNKQLLVNGVGITSLTPITKMMAHFPMAFLNRPPQSALNICFGMGTTFRSLLSWGVPTTSVELVPSVPRVFSYYHPDGAELLRSPLSRVVIDDGRRYLERSAERFDVITIDPPPPIEAAGVSMLYSKEFYGIIDRRLRPDGILQQWLWEGDAVVRSAVARALSESFPYVRVFQYYPSYGFGYQFLASRQPIPHVTGAELIGHMPQAAVRDLMEWPFEPTAEQEMNHVLHQEIPIAEMVAADPNAVAMQDDHPVNEYVLLRKLKGSNFQAGSVLAWYEHTKHP
jgi:predicted membrane-bound spermidine synthase